MITYHLSDKEASTLEPALSLRAMFARHKLGLSWTVFAWSDLGVSARSPDALERHHHLSRPFNVPDGSIVPFATLQSWKVRCRLMEITANTTAEQHQNQSFKTTVNQSKEKRYDFSRFHWKSGVFWKESKTKRLRGSARKKIRWDTILQTGVRHSWTWARTICHKLIVLSFWGTAAKQLCAEDNTIKKTNSWVLPREKTFISLCPACSWECKPAMVQRREHNPPFAFF